VKGARLACNAARYQDPLEFSLGVLLLTDQSEPGTGNIELIPGSHRSPVSLPSDVIAAGNDVQIGHVVCAPAGSVLLFHNAVWHRTYRHDGERDRYTVHYIYSPPWVRCGERFENSVEFLRRTTPLRRALLGDFSQPDAPFGANYPTPPFEAESIP
jgi:ectoine hydroxylase